jgi:hypothetical protein
VNSHTISGNAPDDLDEDHRELVDDEQVRLAPQRQDDTQRQRQEDPVIPMMNASMKPPISSEGTNSMPMGMTLPNGPAIGPARKSQ